LRKIFISEKIGANTLDGICKILSYREGRAILSTALIECPFTEENKRVLNAESYSDLLEIISSALSLSEDESSEYDTIRTITKSTLTYYK
jgi:hypothetical protein